MEFGGKAREIGERDIQDAGSGDRCFVMQEGARRKVWAGLALLEQRFRR